MAFLSRITAFLVAVLATGFIQAQSTQWPLHTDGLTNLVEWDHYSFIVNGERLFVFSGEFHYWRFPVPDLWRDLLEKVKAAGFTAFSIYNSWGFHNPSPGTLDFETAAHNFTLIMEIAKDVGMYMIVRPGPYVNAEANAGGFPLWLTTGAYGNLRTNDSLYTAAWTPYWKAVAEVYKPYLITNGGNVILYQIENELGNQWDNIAERIPNPPVDEYMQLLEDAARMNGISIPLTHNAPNMGGFSWSKDFSNETGNVDVVGLDSYPSCWSCNLSECTGTNGQYVAYQVVNYYDYFTIQSPTQPNFMPEFQGGSYNPWGGPQGGCPNDIGADFANIFYRDLIYQRVTAISLYMLYGGTNWGWIAAPVVASSYDYSSPVSENRAIGSKYYETKLLTHFTRVAKDLTKTNRLGNSTSYSSNPAITVAELRNPDTDAAFYVTIHADSTSSSLDTFVLSVNTSSGAYGIPQYGGAVALNGHQSKIIPTDFSYGSKVLLYSTAEVLTYSVLDGKEILVLWLPAGETGEFTVKGVNSALVAQANGSPIGTSAVKFYPGQDNITVSYTQAEGMTVVDLADGSRVLLLDRTAAYLFWAPTLGNNPAAPENATVLVQGPYLVRSANLNSATRTLELTGDLDNTTTISVFVPKAGCSVSWNGQKLNILSSSGNLITARMEGPAPFQLPSLGPWKYTDAFPEMDTRYAPTSQAWVEANQNTTNNTQAPDPYNPVLYVDDYGIHTGNHIYRATFPTTSSPPTGLFLSLTGGNAFGYSAWLNGVLIGSYLGLSYSETGNVTLSFANATVLPASGGQENILVILTDNSGHDLRTGATLPRGITNATLLGPNDRSANLSGGGYAFTEWKIAGTAGREANIDPVRGPLNEGGLYAERVGMHLPGFDDSAWPALVGGAPNPSSGGAAILSVPGAGVRIFRTVVPLRVPDGTDVGLSFRFSAPSPSANSSAGTFVPTSPGYSNRVRALLFVNGYQYGRFSPYIGNQIDFPVPPGVLDYNGENTIAVTVWSQAAEGAEVGVDWAVDFTLASSYDVKFDGAYLRPEWTPDRWNYA